MSALNRVRGAIETVYASALHALLILGLAFAHFGYDAAIDYLMRHSVGGLPLPYFLILKCSADLLKNIPVILKARGTDDD